MNKPQNQRLICEVCGKEGAEVRRVARSYGENTTLLVIENVPVVNCPHCAESYLTAETLYTLEYIKLHHDEQIDLALMSQPTLSKEWNNPDEDKTWSDLSQLPSL